MCKLLTFEMHVCTEMENVEEISRGMQLNVGIAVSENIQSLMY